VLSAVVIAAGLVFVTRGLGGQLRALDSVRSYDILSALAHDQLGALEARVLSGTEAPVLPSQGGFEEPYQAYRWSVDAAAREPDETGMVLSDVALTVSEGGEGARSLTIAAVWPVERVPQGW
jgi:hypothetical protein